MPADLRTLIWLFPIAFMLHDFEELILGEAWLRKNGPRLQGMMQQRLPAWLSSQVGAVLGKSGAQFAMPVGLIFVVVCAASFLALACGHEGMFLVAASLFFLHGFMHVGQAVMFRGYIPAVVTSVLVAIPYGAILFWRLLAEGVMDVLGMLVYFLMAVVLGAPLVLLVHRVSEAMYGWMLRRMVGEG